MEPYIKVPDEYAPFANMRTGGFFEVELQGPTGISKKCAFRTYEGSSCCPLTTVEPFLAQELRLVQVGSVPKKKKKYVFFYETKYLIIFSMKMGSFFVKNYEQNIFIKNIKKL